MSAERSICFLWSEIYPGFPGSDRSAEGTRRYCHETVFVCSNHCCCHRGGVGSFGRCRPGHHRPHHRHDRGPERRGPSGCHGDRQRRHPARRHEIDGDRCQWRVLLHRSAGGCLHHQRRLAGFYHPGAQRGQGAAGRCRIGDHHDARRGHFRRRNPGGG